MIGFPRVLEMEYLTLLIKQINVNILNWTLFVHPGKEILELDALNHPVWLCLHPPPTTHGWSIDQPGGNSSGGKRGLGSQALCLVFSFVNSNSDSSQCIQRNGDADTLGGKGNGLRPLLVFCYFSTDFLRPLHILNCSISLTLSKVRKTIWLYKDQRVESGTHTF